MDRDEAMAYVEAALPGQEAIEAEAITAGSVNYVWRVRLADGSVIVKQAPPFVATTPDIELDPSRLNVEVRALELFGASGELRGLCDELFRPPKVIAFTPQRYRLIMEDLGKARDLRMAIEAGDSVLPTVERLARFIAMLHRDTRGNSELAQRFDNQAVQALRFDANYQSAGRLLASAHVSDAAELGERATALGSALTQPGVCLTMGDLWPSSILVASPEIRIIDWEFCHYGRPLQDVAHFAAHLWMLEDTSQSADVRERARAARKAFYSEYRESLRDQVAALWDDRECLDASVYVGCEILARTLGAFRTGYVYEGLAPDSRELERTIAFAASAIRDRSFFSEDGDP